jgi:outer membrane lipoprotein-sorting protein
VEGYQVVQSVTTVTTDGGIKVRSLTTFSGYEFNVDIPDSVFAK